MSRGMGLVLYDFHGSPCARRVRAVLLEKGLTWETRLVDLLPDSTPGPEAEVLARAEQEMIHDLLRVLEPRARFAVEQRFGLNDGRKRSYREVGEELGVTAEAARRLVKRAVNTVRDEAAQRIDAA